MNHDLTAEIRSILEDALPLADLDSDFLFAELSSLDITTIMMLLSEKYNITLDSHDVTPKNFMTLNAIVEMVTRKAPHPSLPHGGGENTSKDNIVK